MPPNPPTPPPPQQCWGVAIFQWTLVTLEVDGLDATPLVSFTTDDADIASVSERNKLTGHAVGSATVHLDGRPASFASVTVQVSPETVTVRYLKSRLVTSVVWELAPPDELAASLAFSSSVLARHELQSVLDSGRIVARVEWSDGTAQDIPHTYAPGVDELKPLARDADRAEYDKACASVDLDDRSEACLVKLIRRLMVFLRDDVVLGAVDAAKAKVADS